MPEQHTLPRLLTDCMILKFAILFRQRPGYGRISAILLQLSTIVRNTYLTIVYVESGACNWSMLRGVSDTGCVSARCQR